MSGPLRTVGAGIGGLALYATAAVIAYAPSWAHPTSVVIGGGGGDPAQTMWYLRWVPWAIAHGHDPLTTSVANHPYGINLLDQTSVMALGLLLAPVTVLWGPVAAYTVAATLALTLSAGAGYLLCRRFTSWRPAALAGGAAYGFSAYAVGQGFGHLNLSFVALPPLMLLVVHDLVVRRRRSARTDGMLLAGLVIVQFFISSEILATTAIFSLVAVVVVAVGWPRRIPAAAPRLLVGLTWAAAVAGVGLSWPLVQLFTGPQHISGSVIGFRYYYSALVAPLLPTDFQLLGTAHLRALGDRIGGSQVENGTYLGAPLAALAALTVVAVRRPGRRGVVRAAAAMAVVAFVLSLGTRFHVGLLRFDPPGRDVTLPAEYINRVPLLNQAFPVRYSMFVALFVAVVGAVGMEAVRDRSPRAPRHRDPAATAPNRTATRRASLLAGGLAVVALVPLIPAWPYRSQTPADIPPYFTSAAVNRVPEGSAALVYPFAGTSAVGPQLWQAAAHLRFTMPGGYYLVPVGPTRAPATSTPSTTGDILASVRHGPPPARTPALRSTLTAQLASWKVTSVLVEPVGDDPVGFFTWLTGRAPDSAVGGIDAWYGTRWTTLPPGPGPTTPG